MTELRQPLCHVSMPAVRRWAVVALSAMALPMVVQSQRGPTLALPAADARLGEEFSFIVGVRELDDGRMLVSDARENRVVVASFSTGTAALVGRAGRGPGEYPRAGALYRMVGDSTAMLLDNGGNWVVFDGAAPPASLTPDRSIGRPRMAMVAGFDTLGHVLFLTTGARRTGILGEDSLDVILHERASHTDRAVGLVQSPYGAPKGVAPLTPGGRARRATVDDASPSPAGFFLMDRAVLFPDGWIAIARLHPYRVDWRAPDGTVTVGEPLLQGRPFRDADKRAWLDREALATGKPARKLSVVMAWPETVPPFAGTAFPAGAVLRSPVLAAPDGRAWIERTVTADDRGNRYDVVDRRGALVGVVTLPANQRVAGFGAGAAYVVATDDDGIQRIERHPLPLGTNRPAADIARQRSRATQRGGGPGARPGSATIIVRTLP